MKGLYFTGKRKEGFSGLFVLPNRTCGPFATLLKLSLRCRCRLQLVTMPSVQKKRNEALSFFFPTHSCAGSAGGEKGRPAAAAGLKQANEQPPSSADYGDNNYSEVRSATGLHGLSRNVYAVRGLASDWQSSGPEFFGAGLFLDDDDDDDDCATFSSSSSPPRPRSPTPPRSACTAGSSFPPLHTPSPPPPPPRRSPLA